MNGPTMAQNLAMQSFERQPQWDRVLWLGLNADTGAVVRAAAGGGAYSQS